MPRITCYNPLTKKMWIFGQFWKILGCFWYQFTKSYIQFMKAQTEVKPGTSKPSPLTTLHTCHTILALALKVNCVLDYFLIWTYVCGWICVCMFIFGLTTSGGILVARSWMAFPRMHMEERTNTIPRTTHALQQTDGQRSWTLGVRFLRKVEPKQQPMSS